MKRRDFFKVASAGAAAATGTRLLGQVGEVGEGDRLALRYGAVSA